MKSLNKIFLIVAAIFLMIFAAACNNQQQPVVEDPEAPAEDPVSPATFQGVNGNYEGTLTLTGYLEIESRVCPPDSMCSKDVDYAKFKFSESDSEAIYDFLENYQGNSFAGKKWVGLGCYEEENARIYSENSSDDNGWTQDTIESQDLEKLLAATEQNPVKITLTKPPLSGGSGAPECYSHFRDPVIR